MIGVDLYHDNEEFVLLSRYKKLKQQNKKLREALEFYAKHENHDFDNNDYTEDMKLVEYYELYDKDGNAFLSVNPDDERRVGDDIEFYEDYMVGNIARKVLKEIDNAN